MAAASVQHQQQNGQIIGLNNPVNQETTELDAKMFVVKKANDSQGITALISRQLQGIIFLFYFSLFQTVFACNFAR